MTTRSPESPLRTGVFGVGSLGEHHARLYAALPGVALVGIHDANPARAREIAAKYGTTAFDDPERLADAIEAASVAVPTDLHHAVAGPLLDRGLHLLVEKPIAATVAEAEDLVARAGRRGVALQVGHIERFNPALGALGGIAGPPRFLEAQRLAPYPPARAGGLRPRGTEVSVVLDLMIHDLDLVCHLAGAPVTEVRAGGAAIASPTADYVQARLAFANGAVAGLVASRVHPDRSRTLRLFYPDAVVELDLMRQTAAIGRPAPAGIERAPIAVTRDEPLRLELASFVRAVREGLPPVVDGRRGTDALRLCFEVVRQVAASPA